MFFLCKRFEFHDRTFDRRLKGDSSVVYPAIFRKGFRAHLIDGGVGKSGRTLLELVISALVMFEGLIDVIVRLDDAISAFADGLDKDSVLIEQDFPRRLDDLLIFL